MGYLHKFSIFYYFDLLFFSENYVFKSLKENDKELAKCSANTICTICRLYIDI